MRHHLLTFTLIIFLSCKNNSNQKNIVTGSQTIPPSDTAIVYRFSDFKVDTFNGKKATVDIEHNPLAKEHWLAFLPPSTSSKLAFAGHFAIVRWQHTANAVGGLIVDLVNGDVFELPKCSLGYSYTKTSRLLIVNPNGQGKDCYACKPEYWIWDDSLKVFSILNSSKQPEKQVATSGENNLETTEIICDTVYKNKGYKITLKRFNRNDEDEKIPNSVFTFSKLTNGQYLSLFSDSIFNRVQDIQFTDFNNDNVRDILVQNFSDVRSNWTYYLYLVDPAQNKLKKVRGFEEIKNPHYLPQYNLIDNYVISGENWTSIYKIKGDTVKDFDIVIFDKQEDDESYGRNYKKAIKSILSKKNNR